MAVKALCKMLPPFTMIRCEEPLLLLFGSLNASDVYVLSQFYCISHGQQTHLVSIDRC